MRVFFGLMRLERGRMHSTSKVLLFPRIEELVAASSARASAGASQVRVPELMNRWNDHVLVRRSGKASLQCAWCKLQAKLATSSGRPSLRIRESRLVCSHCTRALNADDKRGIADVALCKALSLSSTEGGATCFYLYHRHFFGSTPVASGAAPAAAADDSELAAPERLDDAMDDAQ